MMRALVLVVAILLAPSGVWAACTSVASTAVAFGTYTGVGIAQSSGTVTLSGCTTGFAYSVGLNAGTGTGGTVTTRKMTNGSVTLNYQMFQNAAQTTNWGNTKSVDAEAGTTTGATQNLTIYAELLGGQYPTPGNYTDTVTAKEFNSNIMGTFMVTATVAAACTVSATNLNFGTYMSSADDYATSTITVTCTNTTPYTVGIDYGVTNQPQNRYMTSAGGAALQYLLFQDAAHTVAWGVPFYNTAYSGTGTGAAQALTVYGDLYAGQYGTPGSYTDTLTVYVNY